MFSTVIVSYPKVDIGIRISYLKVNGSIMVIMIGRNVSLLTQKTIPHSAQREKRSA